MIHPVVVRKQRLTLISLIGLTLLTAFIGLGIGSSGVSYREIVPTLFGRGSFDDSFILYGIRLPRIIITILSGMALAVSGAILQGITKNDLADPGIIGINSGAGVAITVFYCFFRLTKGHSRTCCPPLRLSALLSQPLSFIPDFDDCVLMNCCE